MNKSLLLSLIAGACLLGAPCKAAELVVEWDFSGVAKEYRVYELKADGLALVQTVRGEGAIPPAKTITVANIDGKTHTYLTTAITDKGGEFLVSCGTVAATTGPDDKLPRRPVVAVTVEVN